MNPRNSATNVSLPWSTTGLPPLPTPDSDRASRVPLPRLSGQFRFCLHPSGHDFSGQIYAPILARAAPPESVTFTGSSIRLVACRSLNGKVRMKRMLFNATPVGRTARCHRRWSKLIDLDIESASRSSAKSTSTRVTITRVEPSLEACFVDYGTERNGFLPFKIARSVLSGDAGVSRNKIGDSLKVGQELIVQVEKDESGNKGAALTSFVSLAGRYLVLMPNNPRGGGVSRRIEGEDRNELRDTVAPARSAPGMSIIARTAGIGPHRRRAAMGSELPAAAVDRH